LLALQATILCLQWRLEWRLEENHRARALRHSIVYCDIPVRLGPYDGRLLEGCHTNCSIIIKDKNMHVWHEHPITP
jgi:hypothetical protein